MVLFIMIIEQVEKGVRIRKLRLFLTSQNSLRTECNSDFNSKITSIFDYDSKQEKISLSLKQN